MAVIGLIRKTDNRLLVHVSLLGVAFNTGAVFVHSVEASAPAQNCSNILCKKGKQNVVCLHTKKKIGTDYSNTTTKTNHFSFNISRLGCHCLCLVPLETGGLVACTQSANQGPATLAHSAPKYMLQTS